MEKTTKLDGWEDLFTSATQSDGTKNREGVQYLIDVYQKPLTYLLQCNISNGLLEDREIFIGNYFSAIESCQDALNRLLRAIRPITKVDKMVKVALAYVDEIDPILTAFGCSVKLDINRVTNAVIQYAVIVGRMK